MRACVRALMHSLPRGCPLSHAHVCGVRVHAFVRTRARTCIPRVLCACARACDRACASVRVSPPPSGQTTVSAQTAPPRSPLRCAATRRCARLPCSVRRSLTLRDRARVRSPAPGNGIGDSGARALAEALAVNTSVYWLDLGGASLRTLVARFLTASLRVQRTASVQTARTRSQHH